MSQDVEVEQISLLKRLNAVNAELTPRERDHLLIAYAAGAANPADPAALPYFPLTPHQAEMARKLTVKGLLGDDDRVTELGGQLVELCLVVGMPFFTPSDDTDDGAEVDAAPCEGVPV
ncbi:MAG: hypothetical protein H0X24_17675 [Ktedonobacterales bacterium]|nr:hypothetical protein [Ktedonobacterales bacterium]